MKKAAWLVGAGILVVAIGTFAIAGLAPPRTSGPPTVDMSEWVAYRDGDLGWSLRHPPEWRLQVDEGGCAKLGDPNPQIVVSNLTVDLDHPELGSNSCTDLWDMRELPRDFVVIEVETPGGPAPGRGGSLKRLPLSLEEFQRGHRSARLGVPHGLWAPVWIDSQHQYLVRVWFAEDAPAADRRAASLVVESIRFSAYRG